MTAPGIGPDNFERFLRWLSEDRDTAGTEYVKLKRKLTTFFMRKGCADPSELADETLTRAIAVKNFEEYRSPFLLCFGVARKIWLEYLRKNHFSQLPEKDIPQPRSNTDERERQSYCLEHCLSKLPPHSRELITEYYQGRGRDKIATRKSLAIKCGGEERLRVNTFRIREKLRQCMVGCLEQSQRSI